MERKGRSRHAHGRSELWERASLSKRIARARAAVGRRIRAAREQRNLSQEEAAELVGIHPRHLQRVEAGRTNLTIATMVAVAVSFNLRLRDLFEDVE